jgi:hypothetical protein
MYGSGRDALRALVGHGRLAHHWQRLWVPSYFCQEVLACLKTTGIGLETYATGPASAEPGLDGIDWRPGDAILWVDFFGLDIKPPAGRIPDWVEIVEDHTHDPWSAWACESGADWCVASLRKTLPLGSGGVLWSPIGHPLPSVSAVTPERCTAALEKLAAMLLKAQYLLGHPIEKSIFRSLQLSSEQHIASGPVSGMPEWADALLSSFPVAHWRDRRRQNHRTLTESLSDALWLTVLQPQSCTDTCPFAGILLFDTSGRRECVREKLITARVYPAILWPLEETVVSGVREEDVDFSRRMLAIHCDMRYSRSDMQKVAALVLEFGDLVDG